jgi:hypothetical protein
VNRLTGVELVGHPGFSGLIGVSRRDITPDLGVRARCWGPARHDLPAGVHRPLTLTALALADGDGKPLLLISADLPFFRRGEDEWRIRGRILADLDLSAERVIFHLEHTHSGPSLSTDEVDRPGGDRVAGYLDSVATAAVSAGRQAIGESAPGVMEWAVGSCSLATNRDFWEEGRSLVGYNPAVGADDTLLVGRVTNAKGGALATIVNYACHPTTLAWQNRLLSPDYIGAAREVVEAATAGCPCLFLQGASGELAPREQYVGDTEVADRHGRHLGYAVLSTLSGMLGPSTRLVRAGTVESGAPLAMWEPTATRHPARLSAVARTLELPIQKLASLDELAQRWSGIDPLSLEERLTRARSIRASYGDATELSYPLWVWMTGDCFFVAHPGEAYSFLQRELRRIYGTSRVVVLNLCNGPGFFYLPTEDAFDAGAYSSWQTLVDRGALEALTAEASSAIDSLARATHDAS